MSQLFKAIVIDDEPAARRLMKSLLEEYAQVVTVVAEAGNGREAITKIEELRPDLIFLDIQMPDLTGFEVLERLTHKPNVIFTTAYEQYAIKAFENFSIDYLLKPVKEDELNAAINKFKTLHYTSAAPDTSGQINLLLSQLGKNQSAGFRERFLIRQGQKMISVNTDQVAFFLASNKLNYIITKEKQKFMIDHTLEEVEHMVDPKKFFRANRQLILSQDVVKAIYPWFKGKLKVDVSVPAEEDVLISREKATAFKEWMGG